MESRYCQAIGKFRNLLKEKKVYRDGMSIQIDYNGKCYSVSVFSETNINNIVVRCISEDRPYTPWGCEITETTQVLEHLLASA
jgi:hypothetical protein